MAGQVWSVSADGGYLANPKLSKTIRVAAQPMMKARQFTRLESAIGKGKGDTLDFNKISNVATQGGTIPESSKIPETKITIQRGQMTMEEYGNSIPFTGKLETLSEFSVSNIWTMALRNDMAKVIDSAVLTELKTTDLRYVPTGAASATWESTASATATANLNVFHVKEIVDAMKVGSFGAAGDGNPVPGFDGDNYVCLASVKAIRGIKDDPDWEEAVKYGDPNRLFTGEVGRIYGVRFIETNHTAALSNGVGTGSVLGEALFLGADALMEAVAVSEEIRAKIPGDYGRDKGLAWYFLGGFQLVWDFTTDSEQHVVLVSSS